MIRDKNKAIKYKAYSSGSLCKGMKCSWHIPNDDCCLDLIPLSVCVQTRGRAKSVLLGWNIGLGAFSSARENT